MRKLSLRLALTIVAIAVVLMGSVLAAHAGWFFNAHLDVEGIDTRIVWEVKGDPDGASNYSADIQVWLPEGVTAEIVELADSETVVILTDGALSSAAIEIRVEVLVTAEDGADGQKVKVTITADGRGVARQGGKVGIPVVLQGELDG